MTSSSKCRCQAIVAARQLVPLLLLCTNLDLLDLPKADAASGPIIVGYSHGCGAGPSGESQAYDETQLFLTHGPITSIAFRSGSWMDAMTTTYGNFTAPKRGGDGGSDGTPVTLQPGERVVQVQGGCGYFLDGFILITSLGRRLPVGNFDGTKTDRGYNQLLQPPRHTKGAYLAAFKGISSAYIEQIILVWASNVSQPSVLGQTPQALGRRSSFGAAANFDDTNQFLAHGPLTQLRGRSGAYINGFQARFGGVAAPFHGAMEGQLEPALQLAGGERIVQVQGSGTTHVDRLSFLTSHQRTLAMGPAGPLDVTVAAPPHGFLAALRGVANTTLEKVGFTWGSEFPSRFINNVLAVRVGAGAAGASYAFDDSVLFLGNGRITSVSARWGGCIADLRVSYGGVPAPARGGSAGSSTASYNLKPNEAITQVRTCVEGVSDSINGLQLRTNLGRNLTFRPVAGCKAPVTLTAPPTLPGGYLAALRGIAAGDRCVDQLSVSWASSPGAATLVEPSAWRCLYSNSPAVVRMGATRHPECLSVTGVNCYTAPDLSSCRRLLANPPAVAADTVTCGAYYASIYGQTGYEAGDSWCARAQGQLNADGFVPVAIDMAFFILNVCDSGNPLTVPQLETLLYDDPYGLQTYWSDISFGRAYFNRLTSKIFHVNLPCGTFSKSVCEFDNWAAWTEANADALGIDLSLFDYTAYLAPPDVCPDIGFQTGSRSYVRTDLLVSDPPDINVLKHEYGHLLGLDHSSSVFDEYGDHSTPMGNCAKCSYGAPHLHQLGWAVAIAELNGSTNGTYTIPALVDARRNHITVTGTWFGDDNTVFFVSYRYPKKQDVGLPQEYADTVSIHRVSGGNIHPYLIGTASATAPEFTDTASGLKVRLIGTGTKGTLNVATVWIGR